MSQKFKRQIAGRDVRDACAARPGARFQCVEQAPAEPRFVIQRSEVPNLDAADGIAIIGWDGC